jgi:hypothetical protein
MDIEFTADVFTKFIDGDVVYASPYVIRDSTIQFTTLAQYEPSGLGFDQQPEEIFRITNDGVLWLLDPCCDNFSFKFIRK